MENLLHHGQFRAKMFSSIFIIIVASARDSVGSSVSFSNLEGTGLKPNFCFRSGSKVQGLSV